MQNTYLYFQGHQWENFTAAHIIKELLKNQKIGISANGGVIFNLLNKIEELSLKENFSFKGFRVWKHS